MCHLCVPYAFFLKKGVKGVLIVLKIFLLGIVISCLGQVLECNNAKYFSKKMGNFENCISLLLKERKFLLKYHIATDVLSYFWDEFKVLIGFTQLGRTPMCFTENWMEAT